PGTITRVSAGSSTPDAKSPRTTSTRSARCCDPISKPMKTRPSDAWWATTSPDETRHRQDALLRRLLRDRVVPFTAHYRKLFADLGLDARDIGGTEDLAKLPFTSKRMM